MSLTFIAEIGLNHNGNKGLISELVRQASRSSATYAKFQLGWRGKPGELNHLGKEDLLLIHRICDFYQIEPLFSVFNAESWDLLLSISPPRVVKIASRTHKEDKELVRKIAGNTEEVIISTGMAGFDDSLKQSMPNARFLWCISKYPLLPFEITKFPNNFPASGYAGISDHSQGNALSLIAATRKSVIFERHFTLDKSDTTIRDHALSSTPSEFKRLVDDVTEVSRLSNYLND